MVSGLPLALAQRGSTLRLVVRYRILSSHGGVDGLALEEGTLKKPALVSKPDLKRKEQKAYERAQRAYTMRQELPECSAVRTCAHSKVLEKKR
jgi:hypothetical protein